MNTYSNLQIGLWLGMLGFVMGCFSMSCMAAEQPTFQRNGHPNIIIILADDQGWGATSLQMEPNNPSSASDFVKTPHLERLAGNGVVFTNGYAAHPNCSPTRASILTGKTPARLKMTDIVDRHSGPFFEGNKLIPPPHVYGLPRNELTIAETIKSNLPAYKTAHFGKWHLAAGGPELHGFDASDGETSNREGNRKIEDNPKDIFGITNRGIKWMNEQVNAGNPFYLQLSHYATHLGIEANQKTLEKVRNYEPGERHNQVRYAAMAEDLDEGVGMILDEIEKLGIREHTYVIYLADNGTYPTKDPSNINGPIHGWKATLWQGSIKVPFIISGPDINPGYSQIPVTSCDILPTVCDWLNIADSPAGLDGGSLAPVVSQKAMAGEVQRQNDFMLFYFPHYQHKKGSHPGVAIIHEKYKLIKFYEDNAMLLFNIKEDQEESNNLASANPAKVKELNSMIDSYFSTHNIMLPEINRNYSQAQDQGIKYIDVRNRLAKEPYFILD